MHVLHGDVLFHGMSCALTHQTCGRQGLDVFLGGDDVERKKPDPSIYTTAADRLGVQPSECVVIEDSVIGLKARFEIALCAMLYTWDEQEVGCASTVL